MKEYILVIYSGVEVLVLCNWKIVKTNWKGMSIAKETQSEHWIPEVGEPCLVGVDEVKGSCSEGATGKWSWGMGGI